MLDQILEFLQKIGSALFPWTIVDSWQGGVILRLGKYHRTITPGFHWRIPFLEVAVVQSVVTTTTALRPQSVVTRDGKVMTTEAVVRWSVADAKAYILDIWDGPNVIIDSAQGAIANALRAVDSDSAELPKKILTETRRALSKYGISVEAVTLTTMAPVRVIRLIGVQQVQEPEQLGSV